MRRAQGEQAGYPRKERHQRSSRTPITGLSQCPQARINEAVADFARSANFTVHEFAETNDGRRLMLDERGFAIGVEPSTQDPWPHLCPDDIEGDARDLFWKDEDDGTEDHCEDLSDRLRARGIHITATELRRLTYEVHLSDRLRTRLPR